MSHKGISHDSTVGKSTVLQTAKVKVSTDSGELVSAVVMFDMGADTTYVSKNFVKKCKPNWITSKFSTYSSFGNSKSFESQDRSVYR